LVCESEDTATGDAQDAEDGSVHPSIELPQDTQTWFAPVVPTKPEVKHYELKLEDKDAIVQYLFKPAGQSVDCIARSETEWKHKLHATIEEILVGVPFGEPVVSVIPAPLFGNQYGGDYLDIVDVSWQKCFL
jgi:hypothetical protein